ncbi:34717_t:CDS:2, partial [Gigaspora margarita]
MGWIHEVNARRLHMIVLGAFNTNTRNKHRKADNITHKLQAVGLTSLLEFHDIEEWTWSRGDCMSQIDDIWASYSILLDLEEPRMTNATLITNGDHKDNRGRLVRFHERLGKTNRKEKLNEQTKPTSKTAMNKRWNTWNNQLRATGIENNELNTSNNKVKPITTRHKCLHTNNKQEIKISQKTVRPRDTKHKQLQENDQQINTNQKYTVQ